MTGNVDSKMIAEELEEFSDKFTWSNYIKKMKLYFQNNQITDDAAKRTKFFELCGPYISSVIENQLIRLNPGEKSFKEMITIIQGYFDSQSRPSKTAARFIFDRRNQLAGESVSNYINELKKLAEDCQFGDILDEFLCDRFTCGLSSQLLQSKLLGQNNLTFEKAVEISLEPDPHTGVETDLIIEKQDALAEPLMETSGLEPLEMAVLRHMEAIQSAATPNVKNEPMVKLEAQEIYTDMGEDKLHEHLEDIKDENYSIEDYADVVNEMEELVSNSTKSNNIFNCMGGNIDFASESDSKHCSDSGTFTLDSNESETEEGSASEYDVGQQHISKAEYSEDWTSDPVASINRPVITTDVSNDNWFSSSRKDSPTKEKDFEDPETFTPLQPWKIEMEEPDPNAISMPTYVPIRKFKLPSLEEIRARHLIDLSHDDDDEDDDDDDRPPRPYSPNSPSTSSRPSTCKMNDFSSSPVCDYYEDHTNVSEKSTMDPSSAEIPDNTDSELLIDWERTFIAIVENPETKVTKLSEDINELSSNTIKTNDQFICSLCFFSSKDLPDFIVGIGVNAHSLLIKCPECDTTFESRLVYKAMEEVDQHENEASEVDLYSDSHIPPATKYFEDRVTSLRNIRINKHKETTVLKCEGKADQTIGEDDSNAAWENYLSVRVQSKYSENSSNSVDRHVKQTNIRKGIDYYNRFKTLARCASGKGEKCTQISMSVLNSKKNISDKYIVRNPLSILNSKKNINERYIVIRDTVNIKNCSVNISKQDKDRAEDERNKKKNIMVIKPKKSEDPKLGENNNVLLKRGDKFICSVCLFESKKFNAFICQKSRRDITIQCPGCHNSLSSMGLFPSTSKFLFEYDYEKNSKKNTRQIHSMVEYVKNKFPMKETKTVIGEDCSNKELDIGSMRNVISGSKCLVNSKSKFVVVDQIVEKMPENAEESLSKLRDIDYNNGSTHTLECGENITEPPESLRAVRSIKSNFDLVQEEPVSLRNIRLNRTLALRRFRLDKGENQTNNVEVSSKPLLKNMDNISRPILCSPSSPEQATVGLSNSDERECDSDINDFVGFKVNSGIEGTTSKVYTNEDYKNYFKLIPDENSIEGAVKSKKKGRLQERLEINLK